MPKPAGVVDLPSVASIICELLQTLGHLTRTCDTAAEAMQLMTSEKIDIVLTDIHISGPINGLQLREQIREFNPSIRVLYTSGYPEPFAGGSLEMVEDIEFLPKPLRLETLVAALSLSAKK